MSSATADRNMLFGILAVQMDFIRRDALIVAMNAWVLEKKKPLGRILVEQKALTADTHDLLEALVQKHLAMHGNDAEKSLAAVNAVGLVRKDLENIADPEVQASLGHFPCDPYLTVAPGVGSLTFKKERFRILRPHAKGGLGEVFVASDEELHREVALKEIQDRYADHPESRARFLLEAEITGGLEHPGIVPVYGLGTYADGRPYYAMRFIRGDSLQEVIKRYHQGGPGASGERTLELRNLLRRFIDVCQAIQYAHDRGVLHRDLKPGNIMLGKYGTTLVVDWGLAKVTGEAEATEPEAYAREDAEAPLRPASSNGSEATVAGSAIGTPEFMSPEQAAGRLDLLGPASDVYSLGATLYALLTGKTSVEGKDALAKAQRGDFPRPRQINAAVPAALEAICLKAMALKPSGRYTTPMLLANDLENWLADEPVNAMREPISVKAGRWMRRHKPLVASLLVGVIALSVGAVTLSLLAIWYQSDKAETAREALSKQVFVLKKRAADAEAKAEDNARLAEERRRFTEKSIKAITKKFLDERHKLLDQGDKKAQLDVAINPQFAPFWNKTGIDSVDEKDLPAAIDAFKKALAIDPKNTFYRNNFTIAQKMLALDKRLPGVLDGDGASAEELLELAHFSGRYKERYVGAVKLYAEAFAAEPGLADQPGKVYRYDAACFGALAAKGTVADKLDAKAQAGLRKQALDWLQAELKAHANRLENDPFQTHQQMQRWQRDADLASLRDDNELAKLPANEQAALKQFWGEVGSLAKRARAGYTQTEHKGQLTAKDREHKFAIKMTAGNRYVIGLESEQFNTFLRLEDEKGKIIAESADISPTSLNWRIVFTATRDGDYRIVTKSFEQRGSCVYTVTVCEFATKKN